MITDEVIKELIQRVKKASDEKNTDLFCISRDVFQARLDSFVYKSSKFIESAVIGEIGNNTFDHNWNYSDKNMRGTFFEIIDSKTVILADLGRGLKNSLSVVRKDIKSDLDALKIAFIERISGRAPEQRGNGLKFVRETVMSKNFMLYFKSGNAVCIIKDSVIDFFESKDSYNGCFAILEF